jgi:hypothetical protein
VPSNPGFAVAASSMSTHAQLAAGGAAAATPRTHTHTLSKHDAKPLKQCTPSPRRARRPPPRPPDASTVHTAGASWVLRSLIREASLGVGLGVVFGAVWSTMQTGPVSRRISEYYKNNPTQS